MGRKGVYEYDTSIELTGLAKNYISIPASIILDISMDAKRVAVFSYFRIKKGLDDLIEFSVPSIVRWCGNKPDTRSDGISKKYMDVIDDLKDRGYLTYSGELAKVSNNNGEFMTDKVFQECQHESFAILYLDEVYSILNWRKEESSKNNFVNNAVLLLVFAFFRSAIYRRSNKLKPEEININNKNNHDYDIAYRRFLFPEAYADKYINIANKIGVSAKIVSKAVDILKELGLLVTDEAYRVMNEDGEYKTQDMLFANAYKREDKFLYADGESYSRSEIERKAEIISKYNSKYIINKKKRKTKF